MARGGAAFTAVAERATAAEYLPREIDHVLARRIVAGVPLVVVAGPPLAGATTAVAWSLGLRRAVRPAQSQCVGAGDVARLLGECPERAVLGLDGASLAVLDQITPTVLADAQAVGVQIVVTTRPELVGVAHPDPRTTGIVRDAVLAIGPLTEAEVRGTPYGAGRLIGREVLGEYAEAVVVEPIGVSAVLLPVIAAVAASWEVLGVPLPLTPPQLAAAACEVLARLGVAGVSDEAAHAAIRQSLRSPSGREPVLVEVGRDGDVHLLAHSLVLDAAVVGSATFARVLADLVGGDTDALRLAARAAEARGDDVTAAELLRGPGDAGGSSDEVEIVVPRAGTSRRTRAVSVAASAAVRRRGRGLDHVGA